MCNCTSNYFIHILEMQAKEEIPSNLFDNTSGDPLEIVLLVAPPACGKVRCTSVTHTVYDICSTGTLYILCYILIYYMQFAGTFHNFYCSIFDYLLMSYATYVIFF